MRSLQPNAIALNPDFSSGHFVCYQVYMQLGRYDEAISEQEKAWQLSGDKPEVVAAGITKLRQALAASGARGLWVEEAKLMPEFQEFVMTAGYYARTGDKDDALRWLKKAVELKDSSAVYIGVDPALDSLRSDPRFTDLLRRIGLQQ
jgi:tetratricopeptide (TPR) repeat protein